MNGTLPATIFSPAACGNGADAIGAGVAAAIDAAVCGAVRGSAGVAAAWRSGGASFGWFANSSLVRYRKPPTPIAAMQTTATASGHIQFNAAVAFTAGFLNCGAA